MSATEAARTDAAAAPSSDDLVARIRELQPLIEKNAAQGEADRRVVEESIIALTDAGIFKVAQPLRYGGYQASVRTMLDVSAAVAEADGGTAWVVALCNVCAWLTGLFSEQAQDDVWGTAPEAKVSGVLTPSAEAVKVDGGYRFSGRWSFASGSNNADYICIHGVIEGEQATRFGVLPAGSVQIEDVWHVSGLKGTASNDIVVSDLFVPDEWTGNFAELPKIARHPLDQRQLGARFGSEFAAVAIGIAQAALDDITDIARNKIPATSRSKLAADPVAQYVTGQLATDLYMARTLLHQVGRDDQASAASGPPDNTATAIRRARLSRAASVAASVVEGAYGLSGTTGLFESCPLQRRLRDVRAVTQHYMLSARSAFGPVGTAILSED